MSIGKIWSDLTFDVSFLMIQGQSDGCQCELCGLHSPVQVLTGLVVAVRQANRNYIQIVPGHTLSCPQDTTVLASQDYIVLFFKTVKKIDKFFTLV